MGMNNRTGLIAALAAGLILGLLLGMLLFWVLFPVKWTDANSYDLSPEGKAAYFALVAHSYKLNRDAAEAAGYLEYWSDAEKAEAAALAIQTAEQEGRTDEAQTVRDLQMVLGIPEMAAEAPEEPPSLFERLRVPCLVFFVVLLVLVLGWIGLRVAMRQRQPAQPVPAPVVQPAPAVPRAEEWEGTGQPPLGHFFTTYQLGEDTYDESFSIETPMNEFLGECGVGISETIGVGDPDKVTAFEVWLFDKSDIRTVTKVLMSEYAFQDDSLRAKLASKGEAVLAQPGTPFTLETSGLQVRVDVTELVYGEDELPPGSFFSKLTVELVAMTKPAEAKASAY